MGAQNAQPLIKILSSTNTTVTIPNEEHDRLWKLCSQPLAVTIREQGKRIGELEREKANLVRVNEELQGRIGLCQNATEVMGLRAAETKNKERISELERQIRGLNDVIEELRKGHAGVLKGKDDDISKLKGEKSKLTSDLKKANWTWWAGFRGFTCTAVGVATVLVFGLLTWYFCSYSLDRRVAERYGNIHEQLTTCRSATEASNKKVEAYTAELKAEQKKVADARQERDRLSDGFEGLRIQLQQVGRSALDSKMVHLGNTETTVELTGAKFDGLRDTADRVEQERLAQLFVLSVLRRKVVPGIVQEKGGPNETNIGTRLELIGGKSPETIARCLNFEFGEAGLEFLGQKFGPFSLELRTKFYSANDKKIIILPMKTTLTFERNGKGKEKESWEFIGNDIQERPQIFPNLKG